MLTFQFHEDAKCPSCGKSLDNAPAQDFIVFAVGHIPTAAPQYDQCGWCDKTYAAQFIGDNKITFTAQ